MKVGTIPPDFSLKSVDEKQYSLADFDEKKGLLVLFTCNHCPYAIASWPIILELSERYSNIQFIAINPNDAETYSEDSFENMKVLAKEFGLRFPYLIDETQEVAKAYNAQCTPDPYLFKWNPDAKSFELFYHGRVNDNWQNPEQVSEHSLDNAMKALLAEEQPPKKQNPSMGCSIKWKS